MSSRDESRLGVKDLKFRFKAGYIHTTPASRYKFHSISRLFKTAARFPPEESPANTIFAGTAWYT